MAHSVLFDQDQMYGSGGGPSQSDGLEFYQTQYADPAASAGGVGIHGSADEFYASSYGAATPIVERSWLAAFGTGGFPNEQPLLEELGINFQHIKSKTLAVLNPFKPIDTAIYDDSDMAGPLLFILVLGTFLLLSGKSQFGYIYGVGLMGTIGIWAILNLMSKGGIEMMRTASILGYCLLPIVFLGSLGLAVDLKSAQLGPAAAIIPIAWCSYSSATMFVTVLSMSEQRLLVAYPIGLFYTSFALLTVF
ncbi:Yip1-domain-containing protein [Martensiomyces pterosporus]|nr:Yip1-domain-containing protein [Martensiomyces pterosporus]